MVYCSVCRSQSHDEARFCWRCGSPLYVINPSLQFDYSELVKYEYDAIDYRQFGNNDRLLSFILLRRGDKFGICDYSFSKLLLPCKFDSIECLDNDTNFFLLKQDNKYGVIDSSFSKQYLACKYDSIEIVFRGNASFFLTKSGAKTEVHSEENIVFSGYRVHIHYPKEGATYLVIEYSDKKYGILFLSDDPYINRFSQPLFNKVCCSETTSCVTEINGKKGIINALGSSIPPLFEEINITKDKDDMILSLVYDGHYYKYTSSKLIYKGIRCRLFSVTDFNFSYCTYETC